ncbi:MAG: radical SAM protein [Oscillospiraceae bacterium]|nr:radical SAM protein [Oscillospiraceae bacterium]
MHFVQAKSILSANNGMNIYRGCLHGCIYCDARSDCYQMKHAFEDIEVKINAPQLLETALKSKRRLCMIGTGAMSDPYCAPECELKLMRRCLELIAEYGFGAAVLTKSDLIMRDIDLLEEINTSAKAVVQMTLTTADESLCQIVEPNVCSTARRAEVLMEMKKRKIPTVMWLTPILPFINDTESNIRELVQIGAEAGVWGIITFGIGMTLRSGDREYFYAALDKHFPGIKQRYIRTFGERYEIPSPNGEKLWAVFINECERYGIEFRQERIFQYMSEFPEPQQLTLF